MKTELRKRMLSARAFVKDIQIPSVPESVIKLEEIYSRKIINRYDVVNLIKQDSIIAGELLRTVNSKHFGSKEPIETIEHAVDLIGVDNPDFLNIIKSASFKTILSGSQRHKAAKEIFEYCVDIAFLCHEISGFIGSSRHQSYTLGLFIDASYLIMMNKKPEYASLYHKALSNPASALKSEINLGADHASVGALIGEYWQLPEWMRLVILLHHEKLENISLSVSEEVKSKILDAIASIKIATYIAAEVSFGSYMGESMKDEKDYALWHLGLTSSCLDEVRRSFIVDSVSSS